MDMNKLNYWLRWVAVLPGSIIAGFLITFPLHWLLYISFAQNGTLLGFIELPPRSDIWIEQLLYPFIISITFVYSAYKIAPKYKFKTAIAFFLLYFFSWATVVILSFMKINIFNLNLDFSFRTILALLGAFVGLYFAKKTDNQKK